MADITRNDRNVRLGVDTVAKVVLPKVLKILRAAGTFFA
jgi:hypothetical protein